MGKFVIFSTELGPMLSPQTAETKPTTYVVLNTDPIVNGKYEPNAGTVVRGSVIPTLGGVVVQDFGVFHEDERIEFTGDDALTSEVAEALQTLYEASSAEYYFSDGYDCWLVHFARPDGYWYKRNLGFSHFGVHRYSYGVKLVVLDKENA